MVTTLLLTKVSGVLFIAENSLNPKAFFGAVGNYQFGTDNQTVIITIGDYQVSVPYTGLTVGTSTPTTVSSAKVLLNAIFGS